MTKAKLLKYAVAGLAVAGLLALAAPGARADSTTIGAKVDIAEAISISSGLDLDFATVSAPETGGPGTIEVATDDTVTEGGGSVVTNGTPGAGTFDVSGQGSATYAITGPTVTTNFSATALSLGSLTSDPSGAGTLDAGGAQTIKIGGTLSINAGATAGVNGGGSAAVITVEVNYN